MPARVRGLVSATVGLVCALVLLAPMLLGPAIGPLTQAMGGEAKHLCACGMVAGTCGCPECARLERQHRRDEAPKAYPVLKSQCAGDDAPVAFAPLPVVGPAMFHTLTVPSAPPVPLLRPMANAWASLEPTKPPTPPPENATVRG
jgi:hypothetical protein